MIKRNLLSVFFLLWLSNSNAQLWLKLSKIEKEFCKSDIKQYSLGRIFYPTKYDSIIKIHYKGALYVFAKYGDSIDLFQNLVVEKIDNPDKRKTIKRNSSSEMVYKGLIDTFIINKSVFRNLFSLKQHPALNNPYFHLQSSNPESDDGRFYFYCTDKYGYADTLMLDPTMMRNSTLTIDGWQLKRLILQVYINYAHWLKVDGLIKKNGKGYYILNNLLLFNAKYYYDGKNAFTQMYSKQTWHNYFPFQFVSEKAPKPDNKYPLYPDYPNEISFIDE